MSGLLTSTFRIPGFDQLATLFPQHLATLRTRLHRGNQSEKSTIIKLKFEAEDEQRFDQLQWLVRQSILPKIAWSGRDDAYAVAALGVAHEYYSSEALTPDEFKTFLQRLTMHGSEFLSYFGGFAFDPHTKPDVEWQAFGAGRFVAPQFYFETESGRQRFVAQIIATGNISPALDVLGAAFEAIEWDCGPDDLPLTQILSVDEFPAHERWRKIHGQVMDDINHGKYQKVVLAKKEVLSTASNLPPGAIFQQLVRANTTAYRFYFEFESNRAFLGASPERLFIRLGDNLTSEALAATRPRGKSASESEALGQDLLSSAKDRLEHQIVFEQLKRRFEALVVNMQAEDTPGILEQPFVQHLYQQISGSLKPETDLAEILNTLHPTPALGGFPREQALEAIRHFEDFSRGWFGGPVGWIQGNNAEFAVGIRSALITDTRQMNMYAGVGIVTGSQAEDEWTEMQQKLQTIKSSLGL